MVNILSIFYHTLYDKGILFCKRNDLLQFYCPLIWMFCSRKLNNKINRLHKRSLRIAYEDYVSSFEELLIKDGSVTIQQSNLKVLAQKGFSGKI